MENTRSNLDLTIEDKKQLEEKYKQLEAKTRVSPSNSIPVVQGNTLGTKVAVSDIFKVLTEKIRNNLRQRRYRHIQKMLKIITTLAYLKIKET